MVITGFVIGFLDFTSILPISRVAELLSSQVFGGIDFIDKDVDGEHDVGTLCLRHDFLGIQVDLFGEGDRYTLEIGTQPSASVSDLCEVCDLSAILRQRVERLDDLKV